MPAAELTPALAAALGALQGVAEFLPISSSGHLALANMLVGLDPQSVGHSFNIVVHGGTLLAVLVHYRADLAALTRAALLRPDVRLPPPEPDPVALAEGIVPKRQGPEDIQPNRVGPPPNTAGALLFALILGTLPLAGALVPQVEALVIAAESNPQAVGGGFLITALMLAFAHRRTGLQREPLQTPHPWQAIVIGLAQLVAIMPGISRSGSTMAAAMGLGLGRLPAARFSFLLSVPAVLGATTKEALDLLRDGGGPAIDPLSFIVGFLVSFVVGAATLRLLIHLLVRAGLLPFVPYLLLLSIAVLLFA
jgi:undecaprenyl-diphosphatase